MTEEQKQLIAKIATQEFITSEAYQSLRAMNTPTDRQARINLYIATKQAEAEWQHAHRALADLVYPR